MRVRFFFPGRFNEDYGTSRQQKGAKSYLMASLPGVRQPKPQVSAKGLECSWYFDAMIRCGGIGNQMTALYRKGELDDCSETAEDLQTCLAIKWKSVGDIETATARLQESKLKESTTIGIIWDARESPSLDE